MIFLSGSVCVSFYPRHGHVYFCFSTSSRTDAVKVECLLFLSSPRKYTLFFSSSNLREASFSTVHRRALRKMEFIYFISFFFYYFLSSALSRTSRFSFFVRCTAAHLRNGFYIYARKREFCIFVFLPKTFQMAADFSGENS